MDAPRSRLKDKHDRRRQHQRAQRARKQQAIKEAEHAARCLGKDGKPLKKERTGKAFGDAFDREMKNRGYKKVYRERKVKITGINRTRTEPFWVWEREPQPKPEPAQVDPASKAA